jgi:hypothetical protein
MSLRSRRSPMTPKTKKTRGERIETPSRKRLYLGQSHQMPNDGDHAPSRWRVGHPNDAPDPVEAQSDQRGCNSAPPTVAAGRARCLLNLGSRRRSFSASLLFLRCLAQESCSIREPAPQGLDEATRLMPHEFKQRDPVRWMAYFSDVAGALRLFAMSTRLQLAAIQEDRPANPAAVTPPLITETQLESPPKGSRRRVGKIHPISGMIEMEIDGVSGWTRRGARTVAAVIRALKAGT